LARLVAGAVAGATDRIMDNPADALQNGDEVRISTK